jgi:phosphatidylserine/phosphatidylglycerophosphate/cardiolipin synthase-like enzyme/uncharacterized membrane protein YdjX (TVP38/TMEM64 family)
VSRPILTPNRNTWRIERAERAAVLVDAGQYFGAVREAMINAHSTVFILGWDIDSRTRLVGETGKADDGFPEGFVEFLSALVKRQPRLVVHILVWDYSILYAIERELFPVLSVHWRTPRRVRFCLDDNLPLGASHHQKIVVVDDAVAFSGGLDLTGRRWDTREHRGDDPRRIDFGGAPYAPFHDVQAVVDGKAALALGELARERWERGACERALPLRPAGDPWPQSLKPDLNAVDVGIARTFPAIDDTEEIREVEALFFDMADRAERSIYIENQYLTSRRFAERLASRMKERPALEVVIIAPKMAHSWLEAQTMQSGLARFMQVFADAGVRERVFLTYPDVTTDGNSIDTMVHSKVMVIDDAILRVGSANLNNRSFGLDTECDLALEASTSEHRQAIAGIRNRLLGHFCGVTAAQVSDCLAQTGSLIKTAQVLSANGHSLKPIDLGPDAAHQWSPLEDFADAERPVAPPEFIKAFVGERPRGRRIGRFAKVIGIALFVILLVLAWRFTPLRTITDPAAMGEWFAAVADAPAALLIVLAIFVAAGLVAFPVTLLIAVTAATFGPLLGFAYAGVGALASASVTYGVGVLIGRRALDDVMGPRLHRVRRAITRRGVIAIATVRMVPIAPFMLVNLAAGASRIPLSDYMLGTVLGMLPGLVLMSALGYQIFNILTAPTPGNVLLFVLAVIVWVAASLGIQAIVLRLRRAKT